MKRKPKVGDKMKTWFSGMPDEKSTILAVRKYYGRYTESFKWIVTLTSPGTDSRKTDMAV